MSQTYPDVCHFCPIFRPRLAPACFVSSILLWPCGCMIHYCAMYSVTPYLETYRKLLLIILFRKSQEVSVQQSKPLWNNMVALSAPPPGKIGLNLCNFCNFQNIKNILITWIRLFDLALPILNSLESIKRFWILHRAPRKINCNSIHLWGWGSAPVSIIVHLDLSWTLKQVWITTHHLHPRGKGLSLVLTVGRGGDQFLSLI